MKPPFIPGKNYFVYRNLRTKTWSVRSPKRIVVDRPLFVVIVDAKFLVSSKLRNKVRMLRRKIVHAGVSGANIKTDLDILSDLIPLSNTYREVTYNPYCHDTFVTADDLQPVHFADIVFMNSEMKLYALNPR